MHILIIEDEQPIRETLQELLQLNGHTVTAAADGREGVTLAKQRPDLILCDVGMPGLNGFEAIGEIQRQPESRDIPFIFLTARADREDQRRGMALGADDYITKPFTEQEIIEAIAARVRRQQPLRERIEQLLDERRREVDASWSHELMTPLIGVMGGLELIEAEADSLQPGELRQLLKLIRAGAERQKALSSKLVLFYELEHLKVHRSASLGTCDAAEAIAAGVARTAQLQPRPGDVTVVCDHGLQVPANEEHLVRAIEEVVGNALRFSQAGQRVLVRGSAANGRYRIEVTDEGAGLTAEQRAAVGPFVQFGRERREQQGLGLGLAIARSVAQLAGGELRLDAGPGGRGLRVSFDLPTAS